MAKFQKMTWYEQQKRRKSNPFFRLLDRSFRFRLLIAIMSAFILLALVHRFEVCRAKNYSPECQFADFPAVITVGNVEAFSIMAAALLYILERGQRKQKEHIEMVETINAMRESGAIRSVSRILAIEALGRDGIWFDGQDFQGTNLEGLEVPDVRLRNVNFAGAILTAADFRRADLTGANFTDADLTDADFTEADLTGANFTDADLTDADFTGANLSGVILTGAQLTGTQIESGFRP
ncbi:MAG: pentapeptide repeat-containing protein [Snowella sp.]|nr:pentapeptide repeat-containing protein [Snowella sp.]